MAHASEAKSTIAPLHRLGKGDARDNAERPISCRESKTECGRVVLTQIGKCENEKQIKSRFSLNPLLQPVVQYTGYLVNY